jgi:hypothetical protein
MTCSTVLFLLIALFGADGLDDLPLLKGGIRRISSQDRDGGNQDYFALAAANSLLLADIKGSGTIRRLYIKVDSDDPLHLRTMVLRFYWDGATSPCVECPLGDFFALGHCRYVSINSIPIVTGNKRGLTSYLPMPFRSRARMILMNEGRVRTCRVTYQIDYEPGSPATGSGLFHAQYGNDVLGGATRDYVVLHTRGRGKYVGTILSIVTGEKGWFWEGDEKFYVDGADSPAVWGTGMDDYFGGAWGFEPGFSSPWFGTPVAEGTEKGAEFTGYRFHVNDPVTFSKELLVTFEHRGQRYMQGKKVFDCQPRRDEYHSVAFWYQTHPHPVFTPMPHAAKRISGDRPFTLEAEGIEIVESSGDVTRSDVAGGSTLLFFEADEKGDSITLRTQQRAEGEYEISGTFLRSRRCGVYQLIVNGSPLGTAQDFFNARGGKGRDCEILDSKVLFGRVHLPAGPVTFEFLVTADNEEAEGKTLGIDNLVIRPLQ